MGRKEIKNKIIHLDLSEVRTIIKDQELLFNKLFLEAEESTEREALVDLTNYIPPPHPVIITGLRRCGKSTLLMQAARKLPSESFYYLNFEDERLIGLEASELNSIHNILRELYGERQTFLLDEVQNIPGWETWVRRLADTGFKFLITGSNASLLSKELGTRLTGRYVTIELFPFSFAEYIKFKDPLTFHGLAQTPGPDSILSSKDQVDLSKLYRQYLEEGGLPAVLRYPELPILRGIYQDILNRDIIVRQNISNASAVTGLSRWLLNNPATLLTYSNLLAPLNIKNVSTIKNYISYFSNCYLFQEVSLYSPSARRSQINPKKVYPIDVAFVRQLALPHNERLGQLLETQVFLALRKIASEIYYLKTPQGKEIDFFVPEFSLAVQVCWSLAKPETKAREVAPLEEILSDRRNTKTKVMIVTLEEESSIEINGKRVRIVPISKLLTLSSQKLKLFLEGFVTEPDDGENIGQKHKS